MSSNELYEIVNDMPMPKLSENQIKGKHNGKYPSKFTLTMAALEVGQSFWVELNPRHTGYRVQKARDKFPERGFTLRSRTKNGVKGVRIWRFK